MQRRGGGVLFLTWEKRLFCLRSSFFLTSILNKFVPLSLNSLLMNSFLHKAKSPHGERSEALPLRASAHLASLGWL